MSRGPKVKKELLDDAFDLDKDLDFGDLDFAIDEPKKDRSPVTDFKQGFIEGVKSGPADSAYIKDTLKDLLPTGYGSTIDFASTLTGKVSQTYDEALRAIKPDVKNIKKVLSKTIPADSSLVPTKLRDLLKKWSADVDLEERLQEGTSPDSQRENFLSTQMADIFTAQTEQAQAREVREESKEAIVHGLELKNHRDIVSLLADTAASMARLDQYNRNVNLAFQKKSLEVAYRQLFGIQDLVKLGERQLQVISEVLPNIQKNTGLPDFVKQHSSEFVMEYNKRRLAETVGSGLFGGGVNYISEVIDGLKKKVVEGVKEGASALSDAATQLHDTKSMMDDMGVSGASMAGSQVGEMVSKGAFKKLAETIFGDHLNTNKSIARIGLQGADFVENAGQHVKRFKDENQTNYSSGIGNYLKRTLADLIPNRKVDRNVSESAVNPAGAFASTAVDADGLPVDDRVQKSLTEVIPGYLARLLQEMQITRTGDPSVELTAYDSDRSEFISKTGMKDRIMQRVFDPGAASKLQDSLSKIIDKLNESGYSLSQEAQDSLKHRMLRGSANLDLADEKTLGDESSYEKKEGAAEAAKVMTEFFTNEPITKAKAFRQDYNRLATGITNTAPNIQKLSDQGHMGLLRDIGIISSEEKARGGRLKTTIDSNFMLDKYFSMKSDRGEPQEVKKPNMFSDAAAAVNSSESIDKFKQAMGEKIQSVKAKGKKAKKAAFKGAQKLAKSVGAAKTVDALKDSDEQVSASTILKSLMDDASSSKTGAAAHSAVEAASKKIDQIATDNVHISSAIQGIGEIKDAVASKITDTKDKAKSILERSMVDGEIDYEILAKELAKIPGDIRKAVMTWVIRIKDDIVKEWKSLKEKEELKKQDSSKLPQPPEADNVVKQEQEVPTVGEATSDTGTVKPQDDIPPTGEKKFAKGGVFLNKILTRATKFKLWGRSGVQDAVAGEDGLEAVMPLEGGAVQVINHKGEVKKPLPVVRDDSGKLSVMESTSAPSKGTTTSQLTTAIEQEPKREASTWAANKQAIRDKVDETITDIKDKYSTMDVDYEDALSKAAQTFKSTTQRIFNFGKDAWKAIDKRGSKQDSATPDTSAPPTISDTGDGIERINETLLKILDRLENINVLGMGGSPKLGIGDRSLLWMKDKTVGGLSGIVRATGSIMKGSAQLSGKILGAQYNSAKWLGKALMSNSEDNSDVYIAGEKEPRLRAVDIKNGKYSYKDGSGVLESHKDITKAVVDDKGNEVIREEELPKLHVRDSRGVMTKLVSGASSGIGRALKGALSLGKSGARAALNLGIAGFNVEMNILKVAAKMVKTGVMAGYNLLGAPVDLYTPGVDDPVLLATMMTRGYYTSKHSGKEIRHYKDIDGPVQDRDGNIVVSLEMLRKGLFDRNGKPIRSRFSKILNMAGRAVKVVGKTVLAAQKLAWKATKGIVKAGSAVAGAAGRVLTGGLSSLLPGWTNSGVGSEKAVPVLEQIRNILDARLPPHVGQPGSKRRGLKKPRMGSSDPAVPAGTVPAQEAATDSPAQAPEVKKEVASKPSLLKRALSFGKTVKATLSPSSDKDEKSADKKPSMLKKVVDKVRENDWKSLREKSTQRASDFKESVKKSAQAAKDDATAKLKAKTDKTAGASTGLFGKIAELVDGIKSILSFGKGSAGLLGKAVGMLTGAAGATAATGAAAGTIGAAGAATATTVAGAAATGTAAAATAGAAASGGILATAGAGLATLGTALGAVFGSPVILGGLALAAAGYGAWRVYRHYRDELTTIDKLRLVQYGFHPDDKDSYKRVISFERTLQDRVHFTNSGPDILEDKINLSDIMGIFDLDPSDKYDISRMTDWYRNRFKPVFLTHALTIKQIVGKFDIDKVSSLSAENMLTYVSQAAFTEGPYGYTTLPIKDATYKACSGSDVKAILKAIYLEYKLDAVKGRAKSSTAASINPDSREQKGIKMVADASVEQQKALKDAMPTLPKTNFTAEQETKPTATSSQSPADSKANPDNLKMADGERLDGRNGYRLIKQDGKLKMDEVNPALLKNFFGMVEEYYQLTGKRITVTDAYRSYEDQVLLKQKLGSKAATPGASLHGFGLALDADSKTLDDMEQYGLMRKYGLTRPVGGEPWHVEPVGVQLDLARYKLQPELASKAIEEGAGRGGSGIGAIRNSPMGTRDLALIKKIVTADITPNVKLTGIDSKRPEMGSAISMPTLANKQVREGSQRPGNILKQDSTLPSSGRMDAANQSKFSTPGVQDMEVSKPSMPDTKVRKSPSFAPLPTYAGNAGEILKVPDIIVGDKESVKATVVAAARVVGVDPNVALTTAAMESGLNPSAKSRVGSAAGLNGFTSATWRETLTKHGAKYGYTPESTSVFDGKANALMGAHLLKQNTDASAEGADVTAAYMSHFLGKSGAKKLYAAYEENPSTPAAQILPKAAEYNTPIFYNNGQARSVEELIGFIRGKLTKVASSYGISIGGGDKPNAPQRVVDEPVVKKTVITPTRTARTRALEAPTRASPSIGDRGVALSDIEAPKPSMQVDYPGMNAGIDMTQLRSRKAQASVDNTPGAGLMLRTETILAESLLTQREMVRLLSIVAQKSGKDSTSQQPSTTTQSSAEVVSTTNPTTPSQEVAAPMNKPSTPPSRGYFDLPKVPVSMRRRA